MIHHLSHFHEQIKLFILAWIELLSDICWTYGFDLTAEWTSCDVNCDDRAEFIYYFYYLRNVHKIYHATFIIKWGTTGEKSDKNKLVIYLNIIVIFKSKRTNYNCWNMKKRKKYISTEKWFLQLTKPFCKNRIWWGTNIFIDFTSKYARWIHEKHVVI